jgi:hypothetical protein
VFPPPTRIHIHDERGEGEEVFDVVPPPPSSIESRVVIVAAWTDGSIHYPSPTLFLLID